MSKYRTLWTDMHSNIHHEQIELLPKWIEQIKQIMDFWPIAYYPYYIKGTKTGLAVEDRHDDEVIKQDWEYIRLLTIEENEKGFPMFMGYEWQGAGFDGDHNVFFKDNDGQMNYALRYQELADHYRGKNVIAIPHHLAYQLAYRGKNWDTHDEEFSPFAEIYSSHGSSENDDTSLEMSRHIHMGPRTGQTSIEVGWNRGYRFGVIASGDNHICPAVYGFGQMAVLAESNSKEDIWEAMLARRVYGCSRDRIYLDYSVDGVAMGGVAKAKTGSKLSLNIVASNSIDRVEIIKDNRVIEMIPHTSTWESEKLLEIQRFKFQLELGWGPDRKIFPDIESRKWKGKLTADGKILSIEKNWSNFGQKLYNITGNSCEFEITSYKTTATGKWMGPSAIATEGFTFEIEASLDSSIVLNIDGTEFILPVRGILENSEIIPLMDEARQLLKDRFQFEEYYRLDSWWHNCYKIKINKGVPSNGYTRTIEKEIDTTNCSQIRVRVWQKNGDVAFSSPIFFE